MTCPRSWSQDSSPDSLVPEFKVSKTYLIDDETVIILIRLLRRSHRLLLHELKLDSENKGKVKE